MLFLVSGEGPSDIGVCDGGAVPCPAPEFRHGPMTVIVDRLVERRHDYSPLDAGVVLCVPKHALTERAGELKALKKSPSLTGKKRQRETGYFYKNARVLARFAKELQKRTKDKVVAILFRDSDGTASSERGHWDAKRRSMLSGFDDEEYPRGVPMIPRPKSEAWLICALKRNSYQNCARLEERSGNDDSPNSLKGEFAELLGDVDLVEDLCERIQDGRIDVGRLEMSSFQAFRQRLEDVL